MDLQDWPGVRVLDVLSSYDHITHYHVVLVTHEDSDLDLMAFKGFFESFSYEDPRFQITLVELDDVTQEQSYGALWPTVLTHSYSCELIRLHRGTLQRRYWRPLEVSSVGKMPVSGGVCLITGGCGALAPVLAKAWLSLSQDTIVFLDHHDPKDASGMLSTFREFYQKVDYVCCDVTNATALATSLEDIRQRYGPLSMIFHLAGRHQIGPWLNEDPGERTAPLMPKYKGLIHLDRLTQQDQLAGFVCFSSRTVEHVNP